ncbi:hypothetical protein DYB26_010138, partial [Aphanomyces astaci]
DTQSRSQSTARDRHGSSIGGSHQLETFNITAEFEQLEREVAQFKAQVLVLGQDNADLLLELTANHAIHACARTAQVKQ